MPVSLDKLPYHHPATVTGIVRDASDAVVPGAAVLLRNHETNQLQKTVTDGAGRFRLLYVPVGDYHLSVDAPGFTCTTLSVPLDRGGRVHRGEDVGWAHHS